MSYQDIDRNSVERAQPLEFNQAPRAGQPEKPTTIKITVAPDGISVTAEYVGTLSSIPQAIERLKAAGVLDLVKPLPISAARAKKTKIEPVYNGAGDPTCPKHTGRALKEGKFGLYCPARDDGTERGFCDIKFS